MSEATKNATVSTVASPFGTVAEQEAPAVPATLVGVEMSSDTEGVMTIALPIKIGPKNAKGTKLMLASTHGFRVMLDKRGAPVAMNGKPVTAEVFVTC